MNKERPTDTESGKLVNLKGSCICGNIEYKITGFARNIINCFCKQCRKTSGHYIAATRVSKNNLKLNKKSTLSWFESSPDVFRGFCNQCGSSLFWENNKSNEISIMAGTLDLPTGLKTIKNIFEDSASDYCKIPSIKI
jgi:hypothetical protein